MEYGYVVQELTTIAFFVSFQAKVNNQGQIGMAYTQSLRSGVKLNLSGLVEGRNINAGGHKLGLSLDFES